MLQVAGDCGIHDKLMQQLVYCQTRLCDLAGKIVLESANFGNDVASALWLEGLHAGDLRQGGGGRLDACFVVDVKHGAEESHEKFDCIIVSTSSRSRDGLLTLTWLQDVGLQEVDRLRQELERWMN